MYFKFVFPYATMAHIRYSNCFSCISTIVAPSNLIMTTSIGIMVYYSPLNFQINRTYISQDVAILKSRFRIHFVL